jgi:hypothetical protein
MASVAETGDILDVQLRKGNVHTADDSLDFILAILDNMKDACLSAFLRIDAGFPEDKLLSAVEERGNRYVARIKNNAVLDRMAEPYNKSLYQNLAQCRSWSYYCYSSNV